MIKYFLNKYEENLQVSNVSVKIPLLWLMGDTLKKAMLRFEKENPKSKLFSLKCSNLIHLPWKLLKP